MKKRISLVAMTLLMTVALTACGKTETVSVIDDDTTESHTAVTTSVEEPEASAPVEEQTTPESEVVETEPEVKPVVPPIEEFEYKHDDELGGMVITKYNGSIPMVIIPDEIDGEPVVAIGERAFDSNTSLESITMPDSVTLIDDSAFGGCNNLINVKLSSSLETIGGNAFGACGFSEITLPESLKCIGDSAFHICKNLKSITIPGNIKTIENGVFEKCTNLETVIISEGITAIHNYAFNLCDIKSMILPNTIIQISNNPTAPLADGYVVSIDTKCFKKWGKEMVISYDGDSYTCDNLDELRMHIVTNNTPTAES